MITLPELVPLPERLRHRMNEEEARGTLPDAKVITLAELRELLDLYDRTTEAVDVNQVRVAMLRGFAGQAAGLLEQAKTILGRDTA